MDKPKLLHFVKQAVRVCPDVLPRLSPATRRVLSEPTPYKTFEFFLTAIQGLVNGVYYNHIGGIFIDTLANLISGQITDAYMRAWADEGHFTDLPSYLTESLENMILDQYGYVDQFYRDIVDARIDGTPIEPLMNRAGLWAQRWKEAYNEATRLIVEDGGGRLMWKLGATESHCTTCAGLNGIVAYAKEWSQLGVHPQGGPNDLLECGGWKCDCELAATDKRRSPKAFETIMNTAMAGKHASPIHPGTGTGQEVHGGGGGNFNSGKPYARRTHTDNSPMSEWGHAMFADDLDKVQESYGENVWNFDANAHGDKVADIEDLKEDIWSAFIEDVERGYYTGDSNDEFQGLIDMYKNGEMTKEQFLETFSPGDIVDTAQAYDSIVGSQWLYERVLEPRGIGAVVTPDGAVVFDESMIDRSR